MINGRFDGSERRMDALFAETRRKMEEDFSRHSRMVQELGRQAAQRNARSARQETPSADGKEAEVLSIDAPRVVRAVPLWSWTASMGHENMHVCVRCLIPPARVGGLPLTRVCR